MHQVNVKRNARSPLVLEKYSRSKLNVCIVYTYEERETKEERKDDFGKPNIAKQYDIKLGIRNYSM